MNGDDDLIVDQPLPDAEVWLRELINRTHAPRGAIHFQALKGRAIGPPAAPRPWSNELSGRARSLAGDIQEHAEAALQKAKDRSLEQLGAIPSYHQFMGVAFAKVGDLRAAPGRPAGLDAIFTPNDDPAHADVVVYGELSDEELQEVRDWLQEQLRFAAQGQLDLVAAVQ
jgi:hypothetical protein